MTKMKNPFSSRWDFPRHWAKMSHDDQLLYNAYDMIQIALFYEGILIELEPGLFVPALEIWCKRHPDYRMILFHLADQATYDFEERSFIPAFALNFLFDVFEELEPIVNGEVVNNLDFFRKCRYFNS